MRLPVMPSSSVRASEGGQRFHRVPGEPSLSVMDINAGRQDASGPAFSKFITPYLLREADRTSSRTWPHSAQGVTGSGMSEGGTSMRSDRSECIQVMTKIPQPPAAQSGPLELRPTRSRMQGSRGARPASPCPRPAVPAAVPGGSAVRLAAPASRRARLQRCARQPRHELLAQTVAALWEALAAAVNPPLSPEQFGLSGLGFEDPGKLWVPKRCKRCVNPILSSQGLKR